MKYRVLHSLAGMDCGGAETFIVNVLRNIDKAQYHFDFLLNSDKGVYVEEIKNYGCNVFIVSPRRFGLLKYRKALDSFFRENALNYDAIHVHRSSLSSIDELVYAKKYEINRRILHSHSTNEEGVLHHIIHWLRKPYVHNLANRYLACSEVAADWLFNWTGIRSQVIEIKNGIDTVKYRFNPQVRHDFRKEIGVPDDVFLIAHVGRFVAVKNHSFIIDIFNEITKRKPSSILILAGIGPLLNEIKQKVKSYGLSDKVIFLGNCDNVYQLLSAVDFFLFPSLYEGLPFAPVEAQAAGVRIVCSDRVSPEVQMSDGVKFISLDKPSSFWADEILNFPKVDKELMRKSVIDHGYDIMETIKLLERKVYDNEK